MAEPNTVNKALIVPNTGDLPGAWGTAALNPNFAAIDGMFGGALSLSLAAATTIALTAPAGGITASAGPTQQQNALIKLAGTLTGNAVLQFTLPGFYIVDNRCVVGAFFVQLAPATGTGNVIGLPPGRKCHVFFDGSGLDFANPADPGTAYDLHGATGIPAWMTACSVLPYLVKDGSVYSTSVYPALGAVLGSTFGGNGITTFGVPDERNRARIGLDTLAAGTTSNRVTLAGSGINGTTMGAAGGDQLLQQHTHTYADPGHAHAVGWDGATIPPASPGAQTLVASINNGTTGGRNSTTALSFANITIQNSGSGSGQNMPPTIVSYLPLIKT